MRTVISHFFNEEYLLPWWLRHHLNMFDHGIMIDHGSTDNSADICRQLAPHWRLVRSRLNKFDAWLNDFEVMTYELEVSGWKIALNTTEFLLANPGLDHIEHYLQERGKSGIAATGFTMIDKAPAILPASGTSLLQQKPWAVEDNRYRWRWMRKVSGYPKELLRNRFYHCLPNGMYQTGRHASQHSDWKQRTPNLMVLHYGYSPWNDFFLRRKLQIAAKVPESDRIRGLGQQHLRNASEWDLAFRAIDKLPYVDLRTHELARYPMDSVSGTGADIVTFKHRR